MATSDSVLEPEPFPYGAELVLAQYVLKQELKEKDLPLITAMIPRRDERPRA